MRDRPKSYTRDRDARRQRLKARGEELDTPRGTFHPKCVRCADKRYVIEQGAGRRPCPDCSSAA